MARAAVILAAGQGTRMKSAKPKVMHAIAGLPILGHVMAAARAAGAARIVVVSAPGMDSLRGYVSSLGAENAVQDKPLGTGHAALAARSVLGDFDGAVVVTYGDMPLMTGELFDASFDMQSRIGMAIVAFRSQSKAYGRVIANADGILDRIVEYKDANEDERRVTLCNAGVMAADSRNFFRWASMLECNNAQKEYYLTDVPSIAAREGVSCGIAECAEVLAMGVNSRGELAGAEAEMQKRLRAAALANGVGMQAPDTVYLAHDTMLEADCSVGPFVVFGERVRVKAGAQIKAFSHLEDCVVEEGALVGPYARLRPGAHIEQDAHIGNFVEVKNARIEKGAKANHLAYLGDARVGPGANIGAGTITCNYDGFDKHHTDIGAGAFIGSNSALVAPVTIGDGSYVGAGSVITSETTKDSLALTRAEQKEIPGWAEKFRARKKAEKAVKGKGK